MADPHFTSRVCAPSELSAQEVAAWDQLNASVPELASPFLSCHYARAVQAAGMAVRVCVLRQGGAIVGFLAFQHPDWVAGVLKSGEPVGAEMTDYFGLVAAPDLRITPDRLLALAGLNHLNFSHLDRSQQAYGLTGEQPRIGLRIKIDTEAEHPLEALLADKPKYRKDSERRMRQLAKEIGPIEFVQDVQEASARGPTLATMIANKREQYARTGAFDALAAPWRRALLEHLLDVREDSCRGVLSTLSAGDRWVAIHFGIFGNGQLQCWLPVYNPAMAKYAPGRLLMHYIIEDSKSLGIRVVDRGEGDTSFKRELANEEHEFLRGAWHNASLASTVQRAIHSIKWRLAA